MPRELSRKKRIVYFTIFAVLFLVCIPVIILYSLGYTIDGATLGLSSRGGIYVSVVEPGITIYIGDDIKETTGIFNKEVFIKDLKPKDYLVVAGSEEFWPWAKIITVSEGEVSALYPLLVRKSLSFKEILKTDENYVAVTKLFLPELKGANASTSSSSKISASTKISIASSTALAKAEGITKKKMKIWKDGNFIFATWLGSVDRIPPYFCSRVGSVSKCLDTVTVFQPGTPLGRIDFYPGRDDAIILILDHGISVVEIDTRKYHNFYPIYKGNNPDFRIEGATIYIKDGTRFSSVEL